MKIRFNKLFRDIVFLIIILLMDCLIFNFVSFDNSFISQLYGRYNRTLMLIVALTFIVFYIIKKKGIIDFHTPFIKKYLLINTLAYIIIFIGSIIIYKNQALIFVFIKSSQFLFMWWVLCLMELFRKPRGIDLFWKTVNIVVFITYIVKLLGFIVYMYTKNNIFVYELNLRDGSFRTSLSALGNLMIIVNYWQIRYNGKGLFNYILFIMGLAEMFIIQQTRAFYIVILVSIFIMEFFRCKSYKDYFKNIFLIIFVAVFIIFSSSFSTFINSLSVEGTGDAGLDTVGVRLEAINYFLDRFINNPLFANGFIGTLANWDIVTGPKGNYYYADVGFIGLLAQTGIFSITFMIWPLIRWIRQSIAMIKTKEGVLLTGMTVYALISLISLDFFDPGRVILVPVFIAIFEYFSILHDNNKTELIRK